MSCFDTFVFLCSRLVCTRRDKPLDAVNERHLNVGLVLEQKDTKETKEDSIPCPIVVSRSIRPTSSRGRNARLYPNHSRGPGRQSKPFSALAVMGTLMQVVFDFLGPVLPRHF